MWLKRNVAINATVFYIFYFADAKYNDTLYLILIEYLTVIIQEKY